MIDERIEKSLREIELQLQSLESARKQVEKTVNSFDGLKSTTQDYVNSLTPIQNKLGAIVEQIGQDYLAQMNELGKDREKIIETCHIAVEGLEIATHAAEKRIASNIRSFQKILLIIIGLNVLSIAGIVFLYFLK